MNRIIVCLFFLSAFSACKETGFRKMEGASERATVESARETMQQMQVALERYHEVHHSYPATTEAAVFDSLHDYFLITIDPANLYKNENDQSTYIAIGSRKNKIIYHYPATLGSGEYTLYWIGANGVDEEGRGDDIFIQTASIQKQLSRRTVINFRNDSTKVEFVLSATGGDSRKDSALFQVRSGKNILYEDWWLLRSYTNNRPELTDRERQEIVNTEFDRFLRPSHFERADSLSKNLSSPITRRIDSKDFSDLLSAKLPVFSYYSAGEGSKAIYWSVRGKRIVEFKF
jgi:hypothetical protein